MTPEEAKKQVDAHDKKIMPCWCFDGKPCITCSEANGFFEGVDYQKKKAEKLVKFVKSIAVKKGEKVRFSIEAEARDLIKEYGVEKD